MEAALEPRVIDASTRMSCVGPRLLVNRNAPADPLCPLEAKYGAKGEVLDCWARRRPGASILCTAQEDWTSTMPPSPMPSEKRASPALEKTGIEGLDLVLSGGLTANRLYLIEGMPGAGKTTLAFQFLLEGVRQGERVLYVALSETREEAEVAAASHGWQLDGVFVRELVPTEESLAAGEQYTMFHPAEVELTEATKRILTDVEEQKPRRVVIDSLSEFQ